MIRWLKEYGGAVSLVAILSAAVFVAGARYGSDRALEAFGARVKAAQAQAAKSKSAASVAGPVASLPEKQAPSAESPR